MQLRYLLKKTVPVALLMLTLPSFAITIYSVKSGDSLWRVATKHKIKGTANPEMIKAIKGINAKEYPSVNDNIINVNQKLSIPTTTAEAEDGIKLYTLRHTQYLALKDTTTQNTPTIDEIKSNDTPRKTVDDNPENSEASEENNPKDHVQIPHIPNDIVNVANDNLSPIAVPEIKSEATDSGTVVAPVDNITENALPTHKAKQERSYTLWIILLVIIFMAIWGYRRRNFKSLSETQQIKDRFYEKRMTIPTNSDSTKIKTTKKLTNIQEIITKADQFLDHQDIAQAKAVLQEALNYSPKNLEIRIKLLAVYAADNDQISFNSERDYLASNLLPYDDKRWKSIDALYRKYFFP